MRQLVLNKVNEFSENMLLHYAAPNKNLVVEIMQLDAADLNQIHQDDLSRYILVLGQYLVMLQHNENLKLIEHLLILKVFEHRLNKAKFSRRDIQGKTEKERKAWLLLNVPELQELEQELLIAEAEKILISGMGKANEGLLNALKKESSKRVPYIG